MLANVYYFVHKIREVENVCFQVYFFQGKKRSTYLSREREKKNKKQKKTDMSNVFR